jgi:hypothetical protein
MTQAYDDNLILAYVEGDLAPAERQDFKLALMKDPKLRRLVEQMMADRQTLRDMPDEQPPPDLMEAIDQHLERQMLLSPASAAQSMGSDQDHRRFKFVRIGSFAAMAAMLLLGVGLIYQTFRDMDAPPDATSRQVASDMASPSSQGKAAPAPDTPLALAPRDAMRREATDSADERQDDAFRAMGRRTAAPPAAPPMASAPAAEPARALAEATIAEDEVEQTPVASMTTAAVADADAAAPSAMIESGAAVMPDVPTQPRVAALPPPTETSGIVSGLHTSGGFAPPGMPTSAPGSIATPAPSAFTMFGDGAATAQAAEPPQNLAVIVTAHDPTRAYEKLLAWCETNNAALRFDNPRVTDADDVAELFAAGERKRVAVTFDAAKFPLLFGMFQGSPRIESSLVREPRGLRNRSIGSIDFADLIDRAMVVDPGTLELPPDGKMTVQVVIRPPWTPHALERPEPAPRD